MPIVDIEVVDAENGAGDAPRPVFVTVTASAPPEGDVLRQRIGAIVAVVAQLTRRPPGGMRN